MEVIYQTPMYGYSPKKVAEEFASKYFDKPRQVEKMEGMNFSLVDGVATYKILMIKGIHLVSQDVYQVVRM